MVAVTKISYSQGKVENVLKQYSTTLLFNHLSNRMQVAVLLARTREVQVSLVVTTLLWVGYRGKTLVAVTDN